MRSLRSRLIVGMLAGMTVLLIVASATIYTVQRRQLYRAFDDTLLSSANALGVLVHPWPLGLLFDYRGFSRLPPDRIRQGARVRSLLAGRLRTRQEWAELRAGADAGAQFHRQPVPSHVGHAHRPQRALDGR